MKKLNYYVGFYRGEENKGILLVKSEPRYSPDIGVEVVPDGKIHLVEHNDESVDDWGAVKGNSEEEIQRNIEKDIYAYLIDPESKIEKYVDHCIELDTFNGFGLDYEIDKEKLKEVKNDPHKVAEEFAEDTMDFIYGSYVDGDSASMYELKRYNEEDFDLVTDDEDDEEEE